MYGFRPFVLAIIWFAVAAFGSGERVFAPSADPWPRWEAHEPTDTRTIDHGTWADLLARYHVARSDGADRFRYAAVTPSDRERLAAYLDRLQAIDIAGYGRAAQYAYWLNLYNAATVKLVLDHYPVASIRDIDISPGLFASGPWDAELVTVKGEALSLNDIEHRILRPIWDDPRIHYGVNCASIGCPDLLAEPFTAATLDRQLDAAARAYVNDPRGVAIADGRVTVSRIYDWYIEDFGGDADGVVAHLSRHADPDLRQRLRAIGTLHDTAYDWSLNGAE